MIRHTLKILQQMLRDFKSVSDHFETLCIKGFKALKLLTRQHLSIYYKMAATKSLPTFLTGNICLKSGIKATWGTNKSG